MPMARRRFLSTLPWLAVAAACGGGGGGAPPVPVRGLYRSALVLPTLGRRALVPHAIAAGGSVAGYVADSEHAPDAVAVRVDSGMVQNLVVPGDEAGFAFGMQPSGTLVAGEYDRRPRAWGVGTGQPLAVPPGYFSGIACALNNAGLIVGSFADYDAAIPPEPEGSRPCAWANLNAPAAPLATTAAGPLGVAYAVNGSGVIVGSVSSTSGIAAARWASLSAPVETFAHLAGGIASEARAISDAGTIAGRTSFASGESRAFILSPGSTAPAPLPALPAAAPHAEALALNSSGVVVGHSIAANGQRHAVIWIDGAVVDLNLRLATSDARIAHLEKAVSINENGMIACLAALAASQAPLTHALAILSPQG